MNVIFLDIDGVLNCEAYFEELENRHGFCEIDRSTLPLLKRIVEENNAKIVLSSTWNDCDDPLIVSKYAVWNYLIDSLKEFGLCVYDKTKSCGCTRPAEIRVWLEAHDDVDAWISIEDDYTEVDYENFGIPNHLLQTYNWGPRETCGLQENHVALSKEMFQVQLQKFNNNMYL